MILAHLNHLTAVEKCIIFIDDVVNCVFRAVVQFPSTLMRAVKLHPSTASFSARQFPSEQPTETDEAIVLE